jgi:putative transposase
MHNRPKVLNVSSPGLPPRVGELQYSQPRQGLNKTCKIIPKFQIQNVTLMGTYRQIFYQIVFGTKNRKPTITKSHDKELYKYIWGIIHNKKCNLYRINGMEDHIHIMSDLHPSVCLGDFVKDIKVASSLWIKETGKFPGFDGWQEGYGAFTYSVREKDMVINYIRNQKEHHKTENFFDEFKRLLIDNGIPFNEKYLL